MSDIITTLKSKTNPSDNVYPNIKRDNIPDGAINGNKIENGTISLGKVDSSIFNPINYFSTIYNSSNDKITISALDCLYINFDSISGDYINSNNFSSKKLTIFEEANLTGDITFYSIPKMNGTNLYELNLSDESTISLNVFTRLEVIGEYSSIDINHALDFASKNQPSDFNARDIEILKKIFEGLFPIGWGRRATQKYFIENNKESYIYIENDGTYGRIYQNDNIAEEETFWFVIDLTTDTITAFNKIRDIYLSITPIKVF